jgi:hypothetical protein
MMWRNCQGHNAECSESSPLDGRGHPRPPRDMTEVNPIKGTPGTGRESGQVG